MSRPGAPLTSRGHRVVTPSSSTVKGMTAATTHPVPEWLRELTAARTYYEELLGWPVRVQVQRRRLTIPVGTALEPSPCPQPSARRCWPNSGS